MLSATSSVITLPVVSVGLQSTTNQTCQTIANLLNFSITGWLQNSYLHS